MVKFRQPIRPGDVGRDVLAVKRALAASRVEDYRELSMTDRAGPAFERVLRTFQHRHGIEAVGVYGLATHILVSPRFDVYGRWLYGHAALRPRYVNPFRRAMTVTGRIDQGVDFHGHGPIDAIGDAEILGLGGNGWPGGEYLAYRLLNGLHSGRYVYVAEAIIPAVRDGERVHAGQTIARFRHDAAPGSYPGIETGWGSPRLNVTRAAATGRTGGHAHSDSPCGLAFARFLRSLGVRHLEGAGTGLTFV